MATLNAEKLFAYNLLEDIRILGFAEAIGKLFDDLSDTIDDLNIYDLDNAPAAVLDGYAEMKKIRGYEFCADETEKRALAKLGVLLKRRAGTVWAVQTILETLGFNNVIIWENVVFSDPIADGSFKANGWLQANGAIVYNYYFFEVSADNMAGNEIEARTLIYHYKDAKSYLVRVFNN
jgi:P2-related tail formation protein